MIDDRMHTLYLAEGLGDRIDNFYQLKSNCTIVEKLRSFAVEASPENWVTPDPKNDRGFIPHLKVPLELLKQCPVLSQLQKEFKISANIIFKMDAYSLYNWHKDSADAVEFKGKTFSINVMLQDCRSSLMIATEAPNTRTKFKEYQYQPEKIYFLRANIPHAIVNFENTRLLLSLRVMNISYNDAVEYCQNLNL